MGALAENTALQRGRLEREMNECSTALVDACRTIDFLEKVLARGTDLDLLRLKGHLFRDSNQLRQLEHWRRLASSEGGEAWTSADFIGGWRSGQESESILRQLESVGDVQSHPGPIPIVIDG